MLVSIVNRFGTSPTNPPYGYKKSPDNKDFWIVDEEAAAIVRRVFKLTLEGRIPYQIAKILTLDKVLVPSHYLKETGNSKWQKKVAQDPYAWSIYAIFYLNFGLNIAF